VVRSRVWRRLRPVSLRARATVMAGVIAALLSIAGAAVTAVGLRSQLTQQADLKINSVADQVVLNSGVLWHVRIGPDIRVVTNGEIIGGDPLAEADPWVGSDQTALSLWPFTDPERRVRVYRGSRSGSRADGEGAPSGTAQDFAVIITVRSQQELLNRVVWSLLVGVVALVTVAMGATRQVAARVLRPVDSITREVAALSATDLTRRVPVPGSRDEIARLAETMNTMLDRLAVAADRQRRFVADASHELRSPLAALRGELEIALSHPNDTAWPDVVQAALGDAQRLEHLIADLLLLARLEHDRLDPTAMTPVDVAAVVTTQLAHRDNSRLLWTVETSGSALAAGRPELLARMIGNLLDNAERYADNHITVRVHCSPAAVVLEVLDDGPGIPAADRERIFDRFTRLDEARDRDHGGAGIGLAIARTIASAHGGNLQADENSQGAHFVAHIPRPPTAANPSRWTS
jgi:signal transduction histidine kinase